MANIIIDRQISKLRKKKGVTQEQLAEVLSVTSQAVSKWESAQCCPDISLLPEIAVFFNVTVDELLGVSLVKDENTAHLAEHLIEMSVVSWKEGLLSLVEYAKQAVHFPFLKTAVEITVTEGHEYESAMQILEAAAGDDRTSRLISDCMLLIIKGTHTAAIIKILENRLSVQEVTFLKLKRPDLFPTKEDFFNSIKGKKPMSEKTVVLEKIIPLTGELAKTKLFFSVTDELFSALYGASEQVVKSVINALLDQSCVFHIAWDFKLVSRMPEEKVIKCQWSVYDKINNMLGIKNSKADG